MVSSPGNQSPSLGAFQKSAHQHKPSYGGKELVRVTSNAFHIYDSEGFSGTEDKGPNVIFLKSCSNCSCHSGNSECSGSYESETVDKDQIHEKYIYI